MLVEERSDLAELARAPDEGGRRRREVPAAPAVDRNRGDRRVVREDRLLQLPEIGPRLEAELVGEDAPRLLERLERVRLAAAAIESEHQLRPQPLSERVVGERRAKRGCELTVLAERERNLELLLERVDMQGLEPTRLGTEPRRRRQPHQGGAAPQLERCSDRVGRGADVAVAERPACVCEQLLEPFRVDARAVERVPVGGADDRVVAERGA
jgi:hypothetical protein